MKATVEYWDRVDTYSPHSKKVREETIEADTQTELFIKFYKLNRSLRYCNGSYYKFKDRKMGMRYQEWLKSPEYEEMSFNLYYGSSIVD